MSSGSTHLISPACVALGHACQGGPLPLNEEDKTGDGDEGEGLSKMELIKHLRKILASTKEIRVRYLNVYHKGTVGGDRGLRCHKGIQYLHLKADSHSSSVLFEG